MVDYDIVIIRVSVNRFASQNEEFGYAQLDSLQVDECPSFCVGTTSEPELTVIHSLYVKFIRFRRVRVIPDYQLNI